MADPTISETETLEDRLITLIGERILETGPGFAAESDLYAAGLDSMAIMQLLMVLEEEFSLTIPVESVSRRNFATVRAVANLLREKMGLPTIGPVEPPPPCYAEKVAATAIAAPRVETPTLFESLPLKGCDYFVLSFDTLSHKTGQGGHKAHSFLQLTRLPDLGKLRAVLVRAAELFPMMSAKMGRKWLFSTPYWMPAQENSVPDLRLYSEEGSPGVLRSQGAEPCADAHALMEQITNTPLPKPSARSWQKARFSLIERHDGTAMLIFSWSHLMCDGVGAELFLQELQRLATASPAEPIPAVELPDPAAKPIGWQQRWEKARPIIQFFRKLGQSPIACLGPNHPKPGHTHFLIHTLTTEQTRVVTERCVKLCGAMVSMPFYLACAMRAHDRVFAHRGQAPAMHLCSVPVQTRRKGARGPVFMNHVTMFFGLLERAAMGSIESATAALMEQHGRFLKDKLGESLNDLMHSMSVMPPGLYMSFVKMQMRGPFASFFHSHTGEFASGLDTFLGAPIANAFHVPGIGTPPGTGIFCNEKNGRLVITMCWHEDALDAAERELMLGQFLTDLGAA